MFHWSKTDLSVVYVDLLKSAAKNKVMLIDATSMYYSTHALPLFIKAVVAKGY